MRPYPLSPIPYPLSLIPYPLSPIPYPLSLIPYPLSPIPYPLSLIPEYYFISVSAAAFAASWAVTMPCSAMRARTVIMRFLASWGWEMGS